MINNDLNSAEKQEKEVKSLLDAYNEKQDKIKKKKLSENDSLNPKNIIEDQLKDKKDSEEKRKKVNEAKNDKQKETSSHIEIKTKLTKLKLAKKLAFTRTKKEKIINDAENLDSEVDNKIKSIAVDRFAIAKVKRLKTLGKDKQEINEIIRELSLAPDNALDRTKDYMGGFGIDKNFIGLSAEEILKKVNAIDKKDPDELIDTIVKKDSNDFINAFNEEDSEEPVNNKDNKETINNVNNTINNTFNNKETVNNINKKTINNVNNKETSLIKTNIKETDNIAKTQENNEKIYEYLIKNGELDVAEHILSLMSKSDEKDDNKLSQIEKNTKEVKRLSLINSEISATLEEIKENMIDEQDTSLDKQPSEGAITQVLEKQIENPEKKDKKKDDGFNITDMLSTLLSGAMGAKAISSLVTKLAGPAIAAAATTAAAAYIGSEVDKRQTQYELANTEDERIKAKTAQGTGLAGAAVGAFAGAKAMGLIGSIVGSVVPGLGTAIGGVSGAITGGAAGAALGYYMGDAVSPYIAEMWSGPIEKIPDNQRDNPFTMHEYITKSLVPELQTQYEKASNMTPEERKKANIDLDKLQNGIIEYNDLANESLSQENIEEWMQKKLKNNDLEDAEASNKKEYLLDVMNQFKEDKNYYNAGIAALNEVTKEPTAAAKVVDNVSKFIFGGKTEVEKKDEKNRVQEAKEVNEFNTSNKLGKDGESLLLSTKNESKNFKELVKAGIIITKWGPNNDILAEGAIEKLNQMPIPVLKSIIDEDSMSDDAELAIQKIIDSKKAEKAKNPVPVAKPKIEDYYYNELGVKTKKAREEDLPQYNAELVEKIKKSMPEDKFKIWHDSYTKAIDTKRKEFDAIDSKFKITKEQTQEQVQNGTNISVDTPISSDNKLESVEKANAVKTPSISDVIKEKTKRYNELRQEGTSKYTKTFNSDLLTHAEEKEYEKTYDELHVLKTLEPYENNLDQLDKDIETAKKELKDFETKNPLNEKTRKWTGSDGEEDFYEYKDSKLEAQHSKLNVRVIDLELAKKEAPKYIKAEQPVKAVPSTNLSETEGSKEKVSTETPAPKKVDYQIKNTVPTSNKESTNSSSNPDDYSVDDLFTFYKVNKKDFEGLHPTVLSNLKAMAAEYYDTYNQKIQINSAFRSFEEQAELKEKYGNKAATPGKSMHNYGLAVDMNSVNAENSIKAGLFEKYGFTRPVKGETWHVEPVGIDRKKIRETGMKNGFDAGVAEANVAVKTPTTNEVAESETSDSTKVETPQKVPSSIQYTNTPITTLAGANSTNTPGLSTSDNLQQAESNPDGSLVSFVKGFEGFAPKAFWDYKQYSYGYGSKAPDASATITEPAAATLLESRLKPDYDYVLNYSNDKGYNWNQNQVNSLSSFAYNLGRGMIKSVTNNGKRSNEEIQSAILKYNKAGGKVNRGLVKRRASEAALFGNMTVSAPAVQEIAPQEPVVEKNEAVVNNTAMNSVNVSEPADINIKAEKVQKDQNTMDKLSEEFKNAIKTNDVNKMQNLKKSMENKESEINGPTEITETPVVADKMSISKDKKIKDSEEVYSNVVNNTKAYDKNNVGSGSQASAVNINNMNQQAKKDETNSSFDIFNDF